MSGSLYNDIYHCIKSNQLVKVLTLLKENQKNVDGTIIFKLLRVLACQLKIKKNEPENKDGESVNKLILECCIILASFQDLPDEDEEFTQGVLSIYHLTTLLMASADNSEICLTLSKTFLSCMQKWNKTLKGVEAIAGSFYVHLWNGANKVDSELSFLYRSTALLIWVHSGCTNWNRVIDKLTVFEESSSVSFTLIGSIFDEFLLYISTHSVQGSQCLSSLLQVWTYLVLQSSPSNQHEDFTAKLKSKVNGIKESKQVSWLIDLVLTLSENDLEIDMSLHNWRHLTKDFEIALARIIICALNKAITALSQPTKTKWDRKNQMASTINILLHFCQEVDHLGPIVDAHLQIIDSKNLRIKCLSCCSTINQQLTKLDPSKIDVCQKVFLHVDQFYKEGGFKVQAKGTINILCTAEITAYNVAVTFTKKSDFINASTYFRKALEYLIINQFLENSEQVSNSSFSSQFTTLYESRKPTRDWNGVVSDFIHCLSTLYTREKSSGKVRCKSVSIEKHLFFMWVRFKRDITYGYVEAESRFLKMTFADVFKHTDLKLNSDSAWEFIFEEFQVIDQRKGFVPKAVISAVAEQAIALAKSPFQKGVAYYLMSREGDNFELRYAAAKKSVSKLATHVPLTDSQSQGQIYLALAYLELYFSQQEMLKKKTAEEMESIGPLMKSHSNAEVPPGEDATNASGDGTSLDAVSYSYLKLELEFKNQEWMVKCLLQWEELIQFGWTLKQYSNVVFSCFKSLGYFFSLNGNSFFSTRAWLNALKLAESVNSDEEFVLAASELLKLGWTLGSTVLHRCQSLIENKALISQDEAHFHLSIAWSKYFQHNYLESWKILDQQVLRSSALSSETPSKSAILLISQANKLRSLLAAMPENLSRIPSSSDFGATQAGLKAAQYGYNSLKHYVQYSQQQNGWDFYGQEWNALYHFLSGAVNVARIYLYTAAPREARFFLKEALSAAQKHVSVIRTAEVLLELSNVDLMLDNTMDCQSKLVLICHLMGVAPPVIPDETIANGGKKSNIPISPGSPVHIRTDRRKGIASRKVPEIPIQLEQDSTHRTLMLPLNHLGTSPTTKAREVSDGVFPEHTTECLCLVCSSELVTAIRCTAVMVQAKLWSFMGFQELALEDFTKGHHLVQSICSRMKIPATKTAVMKTSKRLFNVPDCLKIDETWAQNKIKWFQPTIITGMELLLEHVMHRSVTESANFQPTPSLAPLKSILYEFYLGPLEYRIMKLTSAITVISSVVPLKPSVLQTPEQPSQDRNDEDYDDVVILEGRLPPKTPALGIRKPLELPPPRRVRRNLMAVKIEDTITIDDDDDSDVGFSQRRLGKPQKAILYSSESDSDVLPPTPPPTKSKLQTKTKTAAKKKTEVKPPVELNVEPIEKRPPKREALKAKSSDDELMVPPVVAPKVYSRKTSSRKIAPVETDSELAVQPVDTASSKINKKISKTKTTATSKKDNVVEDELSTKLAATKISTETMESQPKRTTRSTRPSRK